MKRLLPIFGCVILIVFCGSCSKDSSISEETVEDAYLLYEQVPESTYNETTQGMYHGAVLSASTSSRGKIWVNIGQNGMYNAFIQMTTGESYTFEISAELVSPTSESSVFQFTGESGSFLFDLSDTGSPEISELMISNEAYYAHLVRSYSMNPASVVTAVFREFSDPMFSGTWSMIADGSITDPNGDGGDGITSVMVVYNGQSYVDTSFDQFDSTGCLGSSGYVPTLNAFGVEGMVISDYQTTAFAGGMTKWDLSYDANSDTYMNYRTCSSVSAGTFSWTNTEGTVMKNGEIIID